MKEKRDDILDIQKDRLNGIYMRAKVFHEKKIPIHISASRNGLKFFYNGEIKELNNDFLMLQERKLGLLPIFLIEIYDIEKFGGNPNGKKD